MYVITRLEDMNSKQLIERAKITLENLEGADNPDPQDDAEDLHEIAILLLDMFRDE